MVVKAPGENTKSRKNSISENVKTLKDIKCGNFSGMLSREKGKKKSHSHIVCTMRNKVEIILSIFDAAFLSLHFCKTFFSSKTFVTPA